MVLYLGIDLGTTGIKVLLIDAGQTIVASETEQLTVSRPHSGWSEQDPKQWIAALEAALDRLHASHREALGAVRAIGLSGQMHGATLLGQDDEVLRPCILWNDTRSHKEAAALDGDPQFRAISGNIVFPGFTAPKLLWVKAHEPECFSKTAKVLLPKDYLRWWLTGVYASDMSDAAGTSWLDTGRRAWSDALLAAGGMDKAQMPELCEGSDVTGRLQERLTSRWGMRSDVVVAGGAGDNAASAIGLGVIEPGTAFVSLGTSGVVFASSAKYQPSPETAVHTFCHAVPGLWHQMGVILAAADALSWLAELLKETPENLTAALPQTPQSPSKVMFLPYLSGERTPHNDPRVRGAFVGLSHASNREALTLAVLEGIAFALRDNLAALAAAGTRIEQLFAVGGGSRSRIWLEILATVLGIPIAVPADGDFGAAFGAARLALVAGEGSDPLTTCTTPKIAETIEPAGDLTAAYEDKWRRFQALYPAIRDHSVAS